MKPPALKILAALAAFVFALNITAADAGKTLPERHAVFSPYPLSATKAQGWMRKWLETQQQGLTGHVEDIKGRCFEEGLWGNESLITNKSSWLSFGVQGQWHEALMWFNYLYGDPALIKKEQGRYDWTLAHPDANGLLGPRQNQPPYRIAAFSRGLLPYYEETHDPQMLAKMVAHYLASKKRAGDNPWPQEVNAYWNIQILAWLYLETGDQRMLDLALECAKEQMVLDFVEKLNQQPLLAHIRAYKHKTSGAHGVRTLQMLLQMAVLYQATGDVKYLTAAEKAYQVLDRSSMLADGCVSAREAIFGNKSWESHEACVINYSSGTFSTLLHDTGDARWADRVERVCLNAGPGAVTKDFKQVQYFSSPNQVIAENTRIGVFDGRYWLFDSGRFDWCCTATVNRIMPSYIGTMWLKGPAGSVVAALYGPSALAVKAGADGTLVTIVERTSFPFSGEVEFEIQAGKPVRFPFWLRIPGWCEGAEVRVNGEKLNPETKSATFVKLDREFQPGDKVALHLPMQVKATSWPDGGIALERGPLVYSLRVAAEKHPIEKGPLGKEFPQLELTPTSPWNYALDVDPEKIARQVEVVTGRMTDSPWSDEGAAPVQLKVPARRVEGWALTDKLKTDRPEKLKPGQLVTPDLPDPATMKLGAKETITLVPLGTTCLRLTVFPKVPRGGNQASQ